MTAFYNEIDPYCAQWLRNLIAEGLIAPGVVDERSIEDIQASELEAYTQCHFFAGLGGWSYALRLAGWDDSRPCWTGSCPCQPFSAAGKGAGFADERHLWPSWYHLIAQCRPAIVFGEQVASATQWLGLVCGDLENLAYAVGFNHIEAASAGAYHRRDRIFFVADTECACDQRQVERGETVGKEAIRSASRIGGRSNGIVANANELGSSEGWQQRSRQLGGTGGDPQACLGWIIGHDGKARRVPESDIRLLAHGLSNRVGRLRAYGNAIVPQAAAAFITAYMQARGLA